MTAASKEDDGSCKITSLTPETKEILHQSILHYLHRSGFSKTLKRFQSEAQIQNDMWKSSSANLEEIYCKFVNGCNQAKDDIESTKKDEKDEKTTKSKKKKKSNADEEQPKSTMSNDEIPQDKVVLEESELKPKKKKKSKHDLASDGETKEAKLDDTVNELEATEPKKKTKDKKTKSNQEDKPATNDTENGDVVKEDKKSSKKRKRLLSDENDDNTKEEEIVEENEKPEKNEGEKSQKSVKKQRIDSTEPKTINAFQRVKIDQVEFAHEKLQDNSYWAKDGADIGYGAKAQEVLGLVRGKGFRHEKTKKKRGSYRGGQIDLQSHSIKFNYSDQE
ncbi:unnamed protein product [Lactuca saligna]|uniref:LisH domain-containing protein n=1 Tax=Lactuca saligna TaxID=75948 RepID=A0AA35Z4G9_LACSI|nr:unnamed protein product [Lactuca saligna]